MRLSCGDLGRPRLASHPRLAIVAAALGFVLLASLLVLLRGRPTVQSDAGVFLSVGARLLEGDRLYVEVFDNKDPLFYYVYAAALALGDWRIPFLLDIVWVALAGICTALLMLRLGCHRASVIAASIAYPLLLTGSFYDAGYTMLPALAVAPAIALLSIRRPGWAGILIGLALMLKVNLALVLVAPVLALWLTGDDRRRGIAGSFARAVSGVLVALSGVGLVLAARGELRAYLATLVDNVDYANAVFPFIGRRGGLPGHVETVYDELDNRWIVVVMFAVGGVFAARQLAAARRPGQRLAAPERLAALFLATSAAVAVTLVTTAIWKEHLQMLALPATYLVAFATERLTTGRRGLLVAGTVVLAVSVGLGAGAPGQKEPLDRWLVRAPSATAASLARVRRLYVADQQRVSYFHLGANDEQGHAAFLDAGFTLACPRFHQYAFSNFNDVLACLFEAKPDVLFTTPSFRTRGPPRVAWDRFVNTGRGFVSAHYRRALASPDADVWVRRDLFDDAGHSERTGRAAQQERRARTRV